MTLAQLLFLTRISLDKPVREQDAWSVFDRGWAKLEDGKWVVTDAGRDAVAARPSKPVGAGLKGWN